MLITIGDHIKRRRLELGLFQRQVAERLGVDECTVTNWEKHRTEPQLYLIPRIIEFLGYYPEPTDPKTLGEELLQYRKSCGVSQKELARWIGIDPTTLGRVERNEGRCLPEVLRKVNEFLETRA